MSCSNCYNGCTEIVSDKCVKYTGLSIPILGIQNGDSLSYVEQALIEYLTSVLDGTGIEITSLTEDYCTLVSQYLNTCGVTTAVDLFRALIKASCDLQTQVDAINDVIRPFSFDLDCLSLPPDYTTNDVIQAIIYKVCDISVDVAAIALDLDTNYVKLADLNTLIQAYLDSTSTSTKYYNRMVPYTVVEFYGDLSGKFDSTGAGLAGTDWEQIYLCNGQNGTPDKRGRVGVGTTDGSMGGGAMNPNVDPAYPGNPNYTLGTITGTNTVVLIPDNMPSHTHTAVSTVTPNPHSHDVTVITNGTDFPNGELPYPTFNSSTAGGGSTGINPTGLTVGTEDLTVDTIISPSGNNLGHANNQPALGCYYIMYIPA